MKNFYLWLVAAMVCIGILPAAAQDAEVSDISFKVNITNAEGITCVKDYADEIPLQNGINEFSVPNGTNLRFTAELPITIKSVVNSEGTTANGFSNGAWYLYVNPEIADTEFVMTTGNIDEFRTAQFTINVDDPSLVNAVLQGYYQRLDLKEGENIIKYDPAVEMSVDISATTYGVPLYAVKKNGVDVAPNWGTYSITLEEDCVIDVEAKLPEGECTVNFSYSEGAESSISVKVNGNEPTDFDGKSLVVNIGDKVTIEGDRNTYKYEEISINGSSIAFWGSYDFVVVKDTEVYVDAHPWGNITATIVVNNPEFITIKNNYNALDLKAGENVFEFPESNADITWEVSPLGILNSVTVNDTEKVTYSFYTLSNNDVIVFDLKEKVFDKEFMVWIDNVDAPACASSISIQSQNDRSFSHGNNSSSWNPQHDFDNGYTLIKYYEALNPLTIDWSYGYSGDVPEYKGQVYLNDERLVSPYGETANYMLVDIKEGDVVKFFMEAAPVDCHVSFEIAEDADVNVVKDMITVVETPAEGFDCFNGTQVIVSGNGLAVSVNGVAVAGVKNEAGVESFTFVVNDPATAVAVTKAGEVEPSEPVYPEHLNYTINGAAELEGITVTQEMTQGSLSINVTGETSEEEVSFTFETPEGWDGLMIAAAFANVSDIEYAKTRSEDDWYPIDFATMTGFVKGNTVTFPVDGVENWATIGLYKGDMLYATSIELNFDVQKKDGVSGDELQFPESFILSYSAGLEEWQGEEWGVYTIKITGEIEEDEAFVTIDVPEGWTGFISNAENVSEVGGVSPRKVAAESEWRPLDYALENGYKKGNRFVFPADGLQHDAAIYLYKDDQFDVANEMAIEVNVTKKASEPAPEFPESFDVTVSFDGAVVTQGEEYGVYCVGVSGSSTEDTYTVTVAVPEGWDGFIGMTDADYGSEVEPLNKVQAPEWMPLDAMLENGFKKSNVLTFTADGLQHMGFLYLYKGDQVDMANVIEIDTDVAKVGTGINGVNAEEDAEYYDMNGLRVAKPGKGLYIKVSNGKAAVCRTM